MYVRLTKSGRMIVLTTDVSCLGSAHAQAVLDLQAGFRTGFAPCLPGKSYQNTIISSVVNHSKSLELCSRLHIHEADIPPCCCLKKNLNAPRPSEHPPVWGKKCQNVRWDQ